MASSPSFTQPKSTTEELKETIGPAKIRKMLLGYIIVIVAHTKYSLLFVRITKFT